jgi:hypothetical protein
MITQLGFLTPTELHEVRDALESWSRMCLDQLGELHAAKSARSN